MANSYMRLDPLSEQWIHAENELRDASMRALLSTASTEGNTFRNYEPKKQEFITWASSKNYPDGPAVSNQKIVLFLSECVIGRPLKPSRHKTNRTTTNGEPIIQTLGHKSIELYVCACMALWQQQYAIGGGKGSFPSRDQALKNLMISLRTKENERKIEQMEDRAAGTLLDGYDLKELSDVVAYCWGGGLQKKRTNTQTAASYLRTSTDCLLAHAMLLRGEDRTRLSLCDLFALELRDEGPTPCWVMTATLRQGKTNHFGKTQYGTVVRHKDPFLCAMRQVAFYLFYKWEIQQFPHPTFAKRDHWYCTPLLTGIQPLQKLSYDTQLKWINILFEATGVSSIKKTHAMRGQGAKHAELHGVSELQIQRAGRWSSDAMSNVYLSKIPRSFVRSTAGFPPKGKGDYYIPRANVPIPDTLVQSLWPWIDQWKAWYRDPTAPEPPGPLYNRNEEPDRADLAGQGFLELMTQLRRILLQDSVIFKQQYPNHEIFEHPLFKREDYRIFEQDMLQTLLTIQEEPRDVLVRKALPELASIVQSFQKSVMQKFDTLGTTSAILLNEKIASLEDLINAPITLLRGKRALQCNDQDCPHHCTTAEVAIADASLPPGDSASSDVSAPEQPDNSIPQYQMNRTIRTVPQLWREWTQGLAGGPSIQQLDDRWQARWRTEQSERSFHSRRHAIIRYIRKKVESSPNRSVDTIVQELENMRRRRGLTLHKLSVHIKSRQIV